MSHNDNCKSLRNRYKCKHCQKGYMREDAREIHERNCIYKEKNENK